MYRRRSNGDAHDARLGDAHAQHAHMGVNAALGDRCAGTQAQLLGRFIRETSGKVAHEQHTLRPFLQHVLQAKFAKEVYRPAAHGCGVIPCICGIAHGGRPFASEAEGQPVETLDELFRAGVQLRPLALQPQGLGHHPANRVLPTGILEHRMMGITDDLHLAVRARIHPEDSVGKGRTVFQRGYNRRAGTIQTEADDARAGIGAELFAGAAHTLDQRMPPVVRTLLRPSWRGKSRWIATGGRGYFPPVQVAEHGADTLCARVDAHDQGLFAAQLRVAHLHSPTHFPAW